MGWFKNMIFGTPASHEVDDEREWKSTKKKSVYDESLPFDPIPEEYDDKAWAEPGVSEEGRAYDEPEEEAPRETDPYHDSAGNKIVPEVGIERVKTDLSASMDSLEVWALIKNYSQFEVELTRVTMLGYHSHGHFFKPGESFELQIFRGDTPTTDASHTVELQYKVVGSGDYFQADHFIRYDYKETAEGSFYIPVECTLTRPVRDI